MISKTISLQASRSLVSPHSSVSVQFVMALMSSSRKSKINILKNGRKLKGTNVYVNEHLSRKNANSSALARAPGVSRVVLIKDKSELDKFDGN